MNRQVIEFSKYNPSGNMTILVHSKHDASEYASIANQLMAATHVCCEQVGFIESTQNAGDGTATKVDKEDQISATEAIEKASVEQSKNDNAAETSNKEATVDAEAQHDAEQQVAEAHAEASKQATSNDSLEAKAENDSTASQSEMSEPKPQEEKKGFFARLFNL